MEFVVKSVEVPGPHTADYILDKAKTPRQVCLLLHGYGETGIYFYKKLKPYLPLDATIVSPNGPFFLPVMSKQGYRVGYSWYFYDAQTDEYVVGMSKATQHIENIIKKEELSQLPLKIIGYSQGGYLAPFAGLALNNTDLVIGLNSQFLDEELPQIPKFRLYAMNGRHDEVVEPTKSQASIISLSKKGVKADFHLIKDGAHRLTAEFLEKTRELLR